MQSLKTGEYYGSHYQKLVFGDLIITDTEYIHPTVDWHTHENPYFTYLLQGKLFEGNRKESYYLKPGSLLFHNWQDAHYNIKPPEFTRGFHIELRNEWFLKYGVQLTDFEGSLNIENPMVKNLMNLVFVESTTNDAYSELGIDSLLIELFSTMRSSSNHAYQKPAWVHRLKELLWEGPTNYSLAYLSTEVGVHPIHLSRTFSTYFGTGLGNYIRLLKLNKAFCMMMTQKYSLTEICYACGFYDQSHFISNFKRVYQTTPSKLLKKILTC